MKKPLKMFISYSHEDYNYMEEFRKWLAQLKDHDLIEDWYDGMIPPGNQIGPELNRNKKDSDIMALLISQEYLDSEPCKGEMSYAISHSNSITPVPIILKECTWEDTKLYEKEFKALPKDADPVNIWENENKAWKSVYKGLKKTINNIRKTFKVKEDFRKKETKIDFVSEDKEQITIDDIFVLPELTVETEEDYESPLSKTLKNFESLVESEEQFFLIKGKDLSGKTTFAKKLYFKLSSESYSPLFADGKKIHKTKNFDDHFREVFGKQITGDYEKWKEKNNKVIIIDNYHHGISTEIIEYLHSNFRKIFLVMDEDEYMTYCLDHPDFAEATLISIKKLSLRKQEKLIRKWEKIGKGKNHVVPDSKVDEVEEKIRDIIARNRIVPRFPFYILSILQTLETFMPHDYKITRYGHCYQALITARLTKKNIKPKFINTCENYLSELANYKFQGNENGRSYEQFEKDYKEKYYTPESVLNKLKNDEYPIIHIQDNSVNFEDPYVYYFFLGRYLVGHPDKELIENLCEEAHLKENTYTIIFTVHHSQNQEILNWILPKAASLYRNVPAATLDKSETEFMHKLLEKLPENIQSDKPPEEVRMEIRDLEDYFYDNRKENLFENSDSQKVLKRAMNMVQVLGQLAKNHSGSFPKNKVKETIRESEKLGLRVLTLIRKTFTSEEIEEWLLKRLEQKLEDKKQVSENDRGQLIRTSIQFLWFLTTVAMIETVADSIGSEELLKALDQVTLDNPTPAYEFINLTVKISHNRINYNEINTLKEKYEEKNNRFIVRLLSYYIQFYLDTHRDIDFRLRQRLCTLFNLNKKNYI